MKNQRGLAPIVIIFLIALGVGGYLVYQNLTKTTSQPQSVTQPSPTPTEPTETTETSPLPSPTTAKPANKSGWKIYSDNKIDFSYQLPENDNWSVKINDSYCQLKLERNEGDQYLCVRVFDNPKGLGRREFYCSDILRHEDLQTCFNSYIEVKETKVGNRDSLYITEPGTQVDHSRVLNHNGKIVVVSDHSVSFPKTPPSEGFNWDNLRDEILSTFRFD